MPCDFLALPDLNALCVRAQLFRAWIQHQHDAHQHLPSHHGTGGVGEHQTRGYAPAPHNLPSCSPNSFLHSHLPDPKHLPPLAKPRTLNPEQALDWLGPHVLTAHRPNLSIMRHPDSKCDLPVNGRVLIFLNQTTVRWLLNPNPSTE